MRECWQSFLVAAAAFAVATMCAAAPQPPPPELEENHELSMEFETPHTDWAQPYALGKVRALYFGWGSYDRGIEARDLVELMQRFDVEAEAVYFHRIIDRPDVEWAGGEAGLARIYRLLERKWDCFIFAGIPVTTLPHQAQYQMYQAVTDGAGVVMLGVDDPRALKPQNQLADLPPFMADDPVGDAFDIKAGRGIRLPARPQIPYRPGWNVDYDYWVERLGRAVLWAAGKPPRVRLTLSPSALSFDRAHATAQQVTARVEGTTGPVALHARLRRDDGATFDLARQQAAAGAEAVFALRGPYPAGAYRFDVIARGAGGVEAWATVPIEITAQPAVVSLDLAADWAEVGGSIAGAVALSGAPAPGQRVRVQLRDARGRTLAQQDSTPQGAQARFAFPVEDWMPMLLEVRGLLMEGEGEASSAYSHFRVTKRNRGRFNFLVWDWPGDTLAPYAEEQLARLGCSVHLRGGAPPPLLGAFDIAQVPYTTRIMTSWDDNGYMRPVCWNDEPAVDKWIEDIVSPYQPSRRHGVFAYSLGDEVATTGACVHPACLEAYRRYLRQEYGDIAALNASWGSDYADFDQVALSAEKDNDEALALRDGLYARWYDRQAFKGYNFVQLCLRFARRFEQLDPLALTGFEGAGTIDSGTDIDLVVRSLGFWSPYPGVQDEILRSIAHRDFIRSNWMGYQKDAEPLLREYWRMVTRGADSVWWWRWDGFGQYRGLLAPHMAPWRAIKEMQRDTQVVRDGLGDLLLKSTRHDDRIAILYSYPSSFANQLRAGPSYGKYEDALQAWQRALRALGLQFTYVTDRMLRLGEFRPARFRVLILPQAEAIGPQEAAAIRDFAAHGGTVIADVRPGVYDHHCKPLERGLLDDVFGIRRGNERPAQVAAGRIGDLPLAGVQVDPAVAVAGGQALGRAAEAPLGIANRVGAGRALLLNLAMPSFPALDGPDGPPAADFIAALLRQAGVEPALTVTDTAGRPVRDTEVIRWRGRGVDFLALLGGKDEPVQVTLPSPRHVYDLRERRCLGLRATFTVRKLPSRATFVALSPVELSPPQVTPARDSVAGGERLAVRIAYPGSRARHAARIMVYAPDGAHAEWRDQVVVVEGAGAEVVLPIAHNDPPGAWTVRAVDLYTNRAGEARFVVR